MRLSRKDVSEREIFVKELFRNNPGMTGNQVQRMVQEKFTKMMRPNRIYALKHQIALEYVSTTSSVVLEVASEQSPEPVKQLVSTDSTELATSP
jgi:type VI protein secretion system component VasK